MEDIVKFLTSPPEQEGGTFSTLKSQEREVPVYFREKESLFSHTRTETFKYYDVLSLIRLESVEEVVYSVLRPEGCNPISRAVFKEESILIGSSFLGVLNDKTNHKLSPLLFIKTSEDGSITGVVSSKVLGDEKNPLGPVIAKIIASAAQITQNWIVSDNPIIHLGDIAELPQFQSIGKKKEFIENLVDDVINSL